MNSIRLVLSLLLSISIGSTFGQTPQPAHDAVFARIEKYYNQQQYDSIFTLFSPTLKTQVRQEDVRNIFHITHQVGGPIVQKWFHSYQNQVVVYKLGFERATALLSFIANAFLQIDYIHITSPIPTLQRNTTPMQLPFTEEWTVFWGGDTKELNYHVANLAQKNAFDFIITDAKGKSYKTTGKTNEDYYAFGKELIAPCEAEVVQVLDGIPDNTPGTMNPEQVLGNHVVLKTAANEYLVLAHFKQSSIVVKHGQKVNTGQVLGLCGNSGNSSEPHLHFHIQNGENMNMALGIKCYFDALLVNGKPVTDYSPIRTDRVMKK